MTPPHPLGRRFTGPALLAGALVCALPSLGAAQSASEILDNALQAYDQRMEGIDNYTVVQSAEGLGSMGGAMGDEGGMTMYFEKTMVDGHPVFRSSTPTAPSMDSIMKMQEEAGVRRSPAETMRLMKDHAALDGSDQIDGHDCWVIKVDDPAALASLAEGAEGALDMKSMTMCLDKENYVPRRITMEGEMSASGEPRPVTMTSLLSDYRDVDGLLHPFKTEISMSGMASGSMSPEEREKTRKQLAEAKAKMADMPEAQRAMMEKMMGGQLEKMEQMLAEDSFTMSFVVQEVKVNAGPPPRMGGER